MDLVVVLGLCYSASVSCFLLFGHRRGLSRRALLAVALLGVVGLLGLLTLLYLHVQAARLAADLHCTFR